MFKTFEEVFNNPEKEVKTSKIYLDKNSQIFHPEGLFSEQIFGPVKDYCCQCGNIKGKENKGKRCPKCGVLCDSSTLRYTEFGYIKLKLPVFFPILLDKLLKKLFADKAAANRIKDLLVYSDRIYYFNTETKKFEIPPLLQAYIDSYNENNDTEFNVATLDFTSKELINIILLEYKIDSNSNIENLGEEIEKFKSNYLHEYPVFGLHSFLRFIQSDYFKTNILPELIESDRYFKILKDHIYFDKLLVCPPELRPYINTDGKIIKHEITKILISIIDINNSINIDNPQEDIITPHSFNDNTDTNNDNNNNEDNIPLSQLYFKDQLTFRLQKKVNKYYELLAEQISGKQGKIRQYIHGKVIDFSSRGVVVPSINIKPYEIEIPYYTAKEVLLIYFISYIINNYINHDVDKYKDLAIKILAIQNGLLSRKKLTNEDLQLIDELFDEFIDKVNNGEYKFYAILNRAPTLWIYNFLVFDIKIKKDRDDYTIGVHPLAVEQMNCDHDGDSFDGFFKLKLESTLNNHKNITKIIHISELETFEIDINELA